MNIRLFRLLLKPLSISLKTYPLRMALICYTVARGAAKWIDVITFFISGSRLYHYAPTYNKADTFLIRPNIQDVPPEAIEDALVYMKELTDSHGRKASLLGVSRGAELALLISQRYSCSCKTSKIKPAFVLADY